MRVKVTLRCSECKQRNYNTMKNKKNDPDRLEMKKYCRFCRKHTTHNDDGVLGNLLGGGPHDLLQLTAELTEVLADTAPGSLEPVFFLDFCHDLPCLLTWSRCE